MDISQLLTGSREGETPADIVLGERVRSYDFGIIRTCYYEGVVESITEPIDGCPRYKVRVEARIFDGEIVPIDAPYVYPPVNGTPSTIGALTNFVERVPVDRAQLH